MLQQSGDTVTGTYPYEEGEMVGTVSGNKLIATWTQIRGGKPIAGDYEFEMSDDCTFTGRWRYTTEGYSREWRDDWPGVAKRMDTGSSEQSETCTQTCNLCTQPPCKFCPGHFAYPPDLSTSELIFEAFSPAAVSSGPGDTVFTIPRDRTITAIGTYHWYLDGGSVGAIGLQDVASGVVFGPWQASGHPGMNGAVDVYWVASPNVHMPAGTYKIIDSDQSTWSFTPDDCTGSLGHSWVFAQKENADGSSTTGQPEAVSAQPGTTTPEMPESAKGGGQQAENSQSQTGNAAQKGMAETNGSKKLFLDGFEWTVVDDPSPSEPSQWVVQNGTLQQLTNIFRTEREYEFWQGTHIVAGSSDWADYILSFDLNPADDDGVGAIVRYQDTDNYYRFIMVQDSANRGPFRRLEKFVDGQRIVLANDSQGYVPGQTYHIQFKAMGSLLEVWMNGEKILAANDNSFRSGKAGFLAYASPSLTISNIAVSNLREGVAGSEEDHTIRVVPITEGDVPADWKAIHESYRQVHGTYMQSVIALSNLLYIDPSKTSYEDFDKRRQAAMRSLNAMERAGQELANETEPLLTLEVKSSAALDSSDKGSRLKVMAQDGPIVSSESNTMEVIKRLAKMGRENPAKAAQAKHAIEKLMAVSRSEYETSMQQAETYKELATYANNVKLASDLALVAGGVILTGGGSLTISGAGLAATLPETVALTPSLVVGVSSAALGPTQALYSYANENNKIIYGGDKNRIDIPLLEKTGNVLNILAMPTSGSGGELLANLLVAIQPTAADLANKRIDLEVDPQLAHVTIKERPLSTDEIKPKSEADLLPPLAPGSYLTVPGTGSPMEVKPGDGRFQEAVQSVDSLLSSANQADLGDLSQVSVPSQQTTPSNGPSECPPGTICGTEVVPSGTYSSDLDKQCELMGWQSEECKSRLINRTFFE